MDTDLLAADPDSPLALFRSQHAALVRPRSTGEILDDAWRLYLADAPLLLTLSGLFTVPAAVALLLLLTLPKPAGLPLQFVLPALTAALLPLTGLGSAACQEAFHRRAEGQPATLGTCLAGALRRGLTHLAAQALVLMAALLGLSCLLPVGTANGSASVGFVLMAAALLLPGLIAWNAGSAVHPVLAAGEGHLFGGLQTFVREVSRQPGKAAAVTLVRIPVFYLAVANLLLLVAIVLWVAGELAGLDTALLQASLALGNPTFLITLVLLAWVLLTPFAEASNYLLHVDARTRYEGLDLWYRVRRLFPVGEKARAGTLLLAFGLAFLAVGPCRAAGADHLAAVREARKTVDGILQEAEKADPYPGGERWAGRLRDAARRLDPAGNPGKGPYRWFYQAIDGFGRRGKEGALQVLGDLSRRLALAEEELAAEGTGEEPEARPALSRDQIKALVPKHADGSDDADARARDAPGRPTDRELRRPVRRDDGDGPGGVEVRGPGVVGPAPAVGFSGFGWIIVAGVALAVVLLACVLFWQTRGGDRAAAKPAETGKAATSPSALLTQPEPQTAAALWRRAEESARGGDFLEAVRCLYLAVLADLHQARLIRYERTRTNGEYVDQVRLKADAPPELQEPFHRLTGLFELKWYGERACRADDYQACRALAEEVRALARGR